MPNRFFYRTGLLTLKGGAVGDSVPAADFDADILAFEFIQAGFCFPDDLAVNLITGDRDAIRLSESLIF